MHKLKSLVKVFICLITAVTSFFVAYKIFRPVNLSDDNNIVLADINNNIEQTTELHEIEAVIAPTSQKILSTTKIIFEYYYESNDFIRSVESKPPYFLLGMTLTQLQDYFQNWTVFSFSSEKVVLRTNVGKKESRYIIGIHEGNVAVFFEEEINGISLYSITETPVNSLPVEEQQKLERGIYIKGEHELNRFLEDFGS